MSSSTDHKDQLAVALLVYCCGGFFKQFGDVGVGLTIWVIAAHTFALLKWEVPNTKWLPLSVIGVIWLFLILCTAIPAATSENYYYPTTYWCSANPGYDDLYYGLDYYMPGIIIILGIVLYVPPFCHRSDKTYPEHLRQQLLVYPTACVVVAIRIWLARMLQFNSFLSHLLVPPTSFVSLAGIGFVLIAFIRGLLYVITRPFILCSRLFTFRSNGGGNSTAVAGGRGSSGAATQRREGGVMPTMPKVAVMKASGVNACPDLTDVEKLESGVRGDGRHQVIEMQQVKPTALQ